MILAVNPMPPTYGTTAYAPFAPTGTSQFFRINNGKNTGPYFFNGFYYASGYFADASVGIHAQLAVYKSADGITWTAVDSGNWKNVTWVAEFYPAAGGSTIYFAYLDGSLGDTPNIRLVSFSMATNTFTTVSTAGPTLSLDWGTVYEPPVGFGDPQIEMQLVVRSDGVWVMLYGTVNGITARYEVDMVTWNGAAWGVPALVSSVGNPNNNGFEPYGMGITPADRVYMLWLNGDDDNLYSSLYHGSTLDAPVLAYTFGAHNFVMPRGPWPTQAFYDAPTDSLIWGFPQQVPFDTTWSAGLLVGATVSTSANFSVVDSGGRADRTSTRGTMAFVKLSGTYYVYYVSLSVVLPSNAAQISVVSAASLAGAWSAPTIFWDWPATDSYSPPALAGHLGIFDQIENLTISVLPAGPAFTIFGEVTANPPNLGDPGSGVQYILDPVAPPAAVITPPGSGGRKPWPTPPNQFDFCLHREYRLFCNIDYNLKSCARLPKCFTVDEREWGNQA